MSLCSTRLGMQANIINKADHCQDFIGFLVIKHRFCTNTKLLTNYSFIPRSPPDMLHLPTSSTHPQYPQAWTTTSTAWTCWCSPTQSRPCPATLLNPTSLKFSPNYFQYSSQCSHFISNKQYGLANIEVATTGSQLALSTTQTWNTSPALRGTPPGASSGLAWKKRQTIPVQHNNFQLKMF